MRLDRQDHLRRSVIALGLLDLPETAEELGTRVPTGPVPPPAGG